MFGRHTLEDMLLTTDGGGGRSTSTGWSSTQKLLWVSRESDAQGCPVRKRRPFERRRKYPRGRFKAAGKVYSGIDQLAAERVDDDVFSDVYGREVLRVLRRFPCFDSSDFLYENRYERWFLIYRGGAITQVKYTDETGYVEVWEDASELEYIVWTTVESRHWHTLEPNA